MPGAKAKTIIILAIIVFAVSLITALHGADLSKQKVSGEYLETYLRSQDIDFDVKPRAHISDEHIYKASGFLYATGSAPTEYNFQHPPLIKYLFGYSDILFGNALYLQILFASLLPLITFFLGMKVFKSALVSFSGSLLLALDPLYQELTKHTLLDLGQAVFAMAYLYSSLYLIKLPIISGLFLGLFAASKFWAPALVFFAATEVFLFINTKKFNFRKILIVLGSAFLVFNLTYAGNYLNTNGFNIIFLQAKTVKYMLHHDVATALGAPLILFLTGAFRDWWSGVVAHDTWSILWPIGFCISIINFIKNKKINVKSFVYLFPVIYILSLSTQAPFSRYYILVLPLIYLNLAKFAFRK